MKIPNVENFQFIGFASVLTAAVAAISLYPVPPKVASYRPVAPKFIEMSAVPARRGGIDSFVLETVFRDDQGAEDYAVWLYDLERDVYAVRIVDVNRDSDGFACLFEGEKSYGQWQTRNTPFTGTVTRVHNPTKTDYDVRNLCDRLRPYSDSLIQEARRALYSPAPQQ